MLLVCICMASDVFSQNNAGKPYELPFDTGRMLQDPCGPVCCYVALKCVRHLDGKTFWDIADDLGWDNGQRVSFTKIADYLNSRRGVVAKLVRTTPVDLRRILVSGDSVAIIAVRRESNQVNHAVCLIGSNDIGFAAVEYPALNYALPDDVLSKFWDGEAIVVTRRSGFSVGYVIAALVVSVIFYWFRRSR